MGEGALTGRTFRVRIEDVCAFKVDANRGVPQGSLLVHLLYLLLVNGLALSPNLSSYFIADDGNM